MEARAGFFLPAADGITIEWVKDLARWACL
jgi:hypothetical protein